MRSSSASRQGATSNLAHRAPPSYSPSTATTPDHLRLVLLPGLHGTGDLFRPLLDAIPPDYPARILSYPFDQILSYDDLLALITAQLAGEQHLVLIAESFSGPLALRFANLHPDRVRAVVLSTTFIRSPAPRWLRPLARPLLFRLPRPDFALRYLIAGSAASPDFLRDLKRSVAAVCPHVLAGRLRGVLDLDCSDALRRCPVPLLYLAADRDRLLTPSTVHSIQAIRPDTRIRTLPGPHLLLQANPRAAWLEIHRFLADALTTNHGRLTTDH